MRLLVLLCLAPLLVAADKYTVYESEHFSLITDGSKGRAMEILNQFEQVRSFFVKTMGAKDPLLKPRVVVFQNAKDYRAVAFNEVAAAHYVNLPQRDYIAIGPTNGETDQRTVVHEYLHLLVRHTDYDLPVWMNEGVAELYSTIQPTGKQVKVGAPIGQHVFLARNAWMPLEELLGADRESKYYNRRQHVGPFYAMSWALVHMLALGPSYRGGFGKFQAAMGRGATSIDALQQTYGKSLKEIEADLKQYVNGNTISMVVYDMQLDKPTDKVPAQPVGSYEWDLAIADLTMALRKYEAADHKLTALTQAEPQRVEAWESLALTRLTSKSENASETYKKARELGSKHPYLLAYSPNFLRKDWRAAIPELKELTTTYPGYVEGRIRYAEHLLHDREPQKAYETLKEVKKISRRQAAMYFPVRIRAAWELKKLEEARADAAQFAQMATTEQEKASAARMQELAMRDPEPDVPAAVVAAAGRAAATAAGGPPPQIETQLTDLDLPEDSGIEMVREGDGIRFRRKPLTEVVGVLVDLQCQDPRAVLHVVRGDGTNVVMAIEDPGSVSLVGSADGKGSLECGPQKRKVKVTYLPKEGLTGGALGLVRTIEFQP